MSEPYLAMDETSMKLRGAWLCCLLPLLACTEDPSVRYRWDIDGATLEKAVQCSEHGLLQVVAEVRDETGVVVDTTHSCFPRRFEDPLATVAGPHLEDGRYVAELSARTRSGDRWELTPDLYGQELGQVPTNGETCTVDAEEPTCQTKFDACACAAFEVGGEMPVLTDFQLRSPPECIDGVDNDGDGSVDAGDASCGTMPTRETKEGDLVALTAITVDVGLLGTSPQSSCTVTGVNRFVLTVGDRVLAESPCSMPILKSTTGISVGDVADDANDDPSDGLLPVTLTVQALDISGAEVAEPISVDLQIPEGFGGTFSLAVDFAGESFHAPVTAAIDPLFAFVNAAGDGDRGCEPPGAVATETVCETQGDCAEDQLCLFNDDATGRVCHDVGSARGRLAIDTLRVRILDAHGRPVEPSPFSGGTPAAIPGMVSFPCPSRDDLLTAPMEWGAYSVEAQAVTADGTVCFSNVGEAKAAGTDSQTPVDLLRVSGIGACRDCVIGQSQCGDLYECQDADPSDDTDDGICVLASEL
jgi:hypothetical protein